jgi:hypothetical protein
MKITLSKSESEKIFHNSLCNGSQIAYYGLSIDYKQTEYNKSKKSLEKANQSLCYEDVWMKMLKDGYSLTIVDSEGEGHYTKSIVLADVHARVELTPTRHLMDAINEEDDGDTADVILQTVFFKDIIFG